MREVGFPDWLLTGMSGLWTTGGVAPERIGLLHRAVAAALREPGMQAVLRDSELDGSAMPPEEFAAYLQRELAQQRAIAERIGFNPRGR
jgi:tripartite-type tricarboxylate transporter receptor subunit TctC